MAGLQRWRNIWYGIRGVRAAEFRDAGGDTERDCCAWGRRCRGGNPEGRVINGSMLGRTSVGCDAGFSRRLGSNSTNSIADGGRLRGNSGRKESTAEGPLLGAERKFGSEISTFRFAPEAVTRPPQRDRSPSARGAARPQRGPARRVPSIRARRRNVSKSRLATDRDPLEPPADQ